MTSKKPMKVNRRALERARQRAAQAEQPRFQKYDPPPGVVPAAERTKAMASDSTNYEYVNGQFVDRQHFQGYPYLANLAQRPEYRKMVETLAREMTRAWCKLVCTGEGKDEKIAALTQAMADFKLQTVFRQMAEMDGFFGRGQLYIDVTTPQGERAFESDDELMTKLLYDPAKIQKGALQAFVPVEPVWTYPGVYNSVNPLAPDFYRPRWWYVMGKTVDRSRLMTFVSRHVPDLLKPSYNFGGLSLTQMAEPYVNNWLRTRDSVGDMLHSFSISGIKTNLSSTLSGGGDDESTGEAEIFNRADLFNLTRDNRGLFILHKESEEFFQYNTPLSGLSDLQAQSQEQMASVSSIPLVFLLGITPQGLNASSEGEILVFETTVHSLQELLFSDHLKTALNIIQLHLFGEIDPEISFQWMPLREMTEKDLADVRKAEAEADAILISNGVIMPEESRRRLASDASSAYHGLDTSIEPNDDAD